MRYKQVETALARALEVKPKAMGAFRARLRHLRNLGNAKLPRTGSGQPIAYSDDQAIEIMLALELERLGLLPARASMIARSIVIAGEYRRYPDDELFIVVNANEDDPAYTQCLGLHVLSRHLQRAYRVCAIINVTACVTELKRVISSVAA